MCVLLIKNRTKIDDHSAKLRKQPNTHKDEVMIQNESRPLLNTPDNDAESIDYSLNGTHSLSES